MYLIIRILVVGSTKWIQTKNSGKPTVEALNMSYDENISSVEAINRLNELARAKLNAGIYITALRLWDYWTFDIQDLVPLLFLVREAHRRPVQVLVRLNDPNPQQQTSDLCQSKKYSTLH